MQRPLASAAWIVHSAPMHPSLTIRIATTADLPALRTVMARAIGELQRAFLTDAQVRASHALMGLDTRLIEDGTYLLAEAGDAIAGCGGWSPRETLYGGDHSIVLRTPRLLDPASEPARVRAMYTNPDFARRGVGRLILEACERAAADAGYRAVVMMATLSGEPLYRACGYREIERTVATAGNVAVPLVLMGKSLLVDGTDRP